MIVTRSWLNEWIDLSDIETDRLLKTFNSIGLEVDSHRRYNVPKKIVFGKVLECEKHPNADKLSVCKVDIGTSIRQIVCGAKNVRAGLNVAVATIGSKLPNGTEIKHATLRGVESEGMICSPSEIGIDDFCEGILEIDNSITGFKLGDELNTHPIFNDDIIEIELTANRGDCLSIMGVARDLSAAFNKPLKDNSIDKLPDTKKMGIGRIFSLAHKNDLDVSLFYKAIEFNSINISTLISLRLKQIDEVKKDNISSLLYYVTHSTGVILRGYDYEFFKDDENHAKAEIRYDNDLYVMFSNNQRASSVGINQCDESKPNDNSKIVIIEASYIDPQRVAKSLLDKDIPTDDLYYRSSRGSEPNLEYGANYFIKTIKDICDFEVFNGDIEINDNYDEKIISVDKYDIDNLIGYEVENSTITNILKNLGFKVNRTSNKFAITVPKFRHDIENSHDIVEEIVRLVGIDNIPSKPFQIVEKNRLSKDYFEYKKKRFFRLQAAKCGFFESIHFIFDEKDSLLKYGFNTIAEEKELLNPIVNTLDTLRPTILHWLLKSASLNKNNGYKSIKLFEIGSVFNENREESLKFSGIFSGYKEKDSILNNGKPSFVDFEHFVKTLSNIIGDFELIKHTPTHKLFHPYQSAKIIKDDQEIGELFKLHPLVQRDFDLDVTYMFEIDFNKLKFGIKKANEISKYQSSIRDISLLVPKNIEYKDIKDVIQNSKGDYVVSFYPIDKFEDKSLGENISLTIRLVLRSFEKTLTDEDINENIDNILNALKENLNIGLR